jgi:DNA-binding NarL/FixJ family response regulator
MRRERHLVEAARRQAESVRSATHRKHENPAGLSERELEVLALIALGQSNKEIAERLVLSVRTVEKHIANIYGKADLNGRADATLLATRMGLVE